MPRPPEASLGRFDGQLDPDTARLVIIDETGAAVIRL